MWDTFESPQNTKTPPKPPLQLGTLRTSNARKFQRKSHQHTLILLNWERYGESFQYACTCRSAGFRMGRCAGAAGQMVRRQGGFHTFLIFDASLERSISSGKTGASVTAVSSGINSSGSSHGQQVCPSMASCGLSVLSAVLQYDLHVNIRNYGTATKRQETSYSSKCKNRAS